MKKKIFIVLAVLAVLMAIIGGPFFAIALIGLIGAPISLGVLIYSFIKKNKPLRNRALLFIPLSLVMLIGGGSLMPSSESEATLPKTGGSTSSSSSSVRVKTKESTAPEQLAIQLDNNSLETDAQGKTVIRGTTAPLATIELVSDTQTVQEQADADGAFEIDYVLATDAKETVTLNITSKGQEVSEHIMILPSTAFSDQLKKEAAQLAEQQKASEEKAKAEEAQRVAAQQEADRIATEQAQAAQAAAEAAAAEAQAAADAAQAQAQEANTTETQYVDANGNGLIKGSKNGKYHVPGSTYYDRTTNPVAWFKTISEAEAAGYVAPKA